MGACAKWGCAATLAVVALAGCGQTGAGTRSAAAGAHSGNGAGWPANGAPRPASAAVRHAGAMAGPSAGGGAGMPAPGGLVYSTASAESVQLQPASGSCHAVGTGLYSRPDPRCTPGALNPEVTQATIDSTICVRGWTANVRPPEAVTEPEKEASMAAYGDTGSPAGYEYDHLVPLELGGAVNDPRNLWPEPGASPNPKDAVEEELNHKVCDGEMALARAQRAIATDWIALAAPSGSDGVAGAAPTRAGIATPVVVTTGAAPVGTGSPGGVGRGARCSVSAAYNATYHDYDVYVRSNRPEQTVTVSDAGGRFATWSTDGGGYADVHFRANGDFSGETVTVHLGGASCSTTL